MDFLRRELAPISPKGWEAIDTIAKDTLTVHLSGRKFLDLDGPHGIGYAAATLGRLSLPKDKASSGFSYGVRQVLPLVEARRPFSLRTWDLDDIERGAKDCDLSPLVEACAEVAAFEEKAIYQGLKEASITGLLSVAPGQPLSFRLEDNALMEAISEAQESLVKDGVESAAHLVVPPKLWKFLSRISSGGTLRNVLERQLGGKVIYSDHVEEALMISTRGGDAELVLGQDLAIGYHSHSSTEVNLFLTESFTFRVNAPEALRRFKIT